MNYIIEGIDNIGKSTLIKEIQNVEGYKIKVHHEKPQKLKHYQNDLALYAKKSIVKGFELLSTNENIIFDRFHLGEILYSTLYRDYDVNFVHDIEKASIKNPFGNLRNNTKLILLCTHNIYNITDDGKSINHENSKNEQLIFIELYHLSSFINKQIIYIDDESGIRKSTEEIYKEINN